MDPIVENIPVIWKKPHTSANIFHAGTISILLDKFIKRFKEKLQIQHIMIDLEMPKDAAGLSNKTFLVKLHVKLHSGQILLAHSQQRSLDEVMKDITNKIENQSYKTDRQKHV